MMCPNDPTLPRWLCMERECEEAERRGRPIEHAGMDHRPLGDLHYSKMKEIPDWPVEKKHPMMTIEGITYMLEYDGIFYSVVGSWQASDGDTAYK